jgi:hypothetical protein
LFFAQSAAVSFAGSLCGRRRDEMVSLRITTRTRGSIVLGWNLSDHPLCSASWRLPHAMNGPAPSVHMQRRTAPRVVARGADPAFAVTLFDRRGNLLGGSTVASLPGHVEVPRGINLRIQDLHPYLDGSPGDWRGRAFSLVSAMWLRVKGERVRVGIYAEDGQGRMSLDIMQLDLASMAAILEDQAPALAAAPPRC